MMGTLETGSNWIFRNTVLLYLELGVSYRNTIQYRSPVVLVVSCHARLLLSRNDPHLQEKVVYPSYSAIEYNGNGLGYLFASENEIVDPRQILCGGETPPVTSRYFRLISLVGRRRKFLGRRLSQLAFRKVPLTSLHPLSLYLSASTPHSVRENHMEHYMIVMSCEVLGLIK
jgi:hypothetical protein